MNMKNLRKWFSTKQDKMPTNYNDPGDGKGEGWYIVS